MRLKSLKMPLSSPRARRPHRQSCSFGSLTLSCARRTRVVGILNATPDSFSDGGAYFGDIEKAVKHIVRMAADGADVIDVGGESTRPGSIGVTADEELKRVIPIIREASQAVRIPISIDTSKSEVALEALRNGASIVNDVTALRGDPRLASVVSDYGAGLILMHMRGMPRTMQEDPVYDDVVAEVIESLKGSIDRALAAGIREERIIIDPGIGFGKTLGHNLEILRRLSEFGILGRPIMVGVSRKSFLGTILGKEVGERLIGTVAASAAAIMNGADFVRTHDTQEAVEAVRVLDAIMGKGRA